MRLDAPRRQSFGKPATICDHRFTVKAHGKHCVLRKTVLCSWRRTIAGKRFAGACHCERRNFVRASGCGTRPRGRAQGSGRPLGDAGRDGNSLAVLPLLQFRHRPRADTRPVAFAGSARLRQRQLLRRPDAGPGSGRRGLRSGRPAHYGRAPVGADDDRCTAACHSRVGNRPRARPLRRRSWLRRQLHGRRRADLALASASVVGNRFELAVRAEPGRPAAGRPAAGGGRRDGRLA